MALFATLACNGSATTPNWLGYYNDIIPEYSTLIYQNSPTVYSSAKTNYSLGSDVLVRGYQFDYKTHTGSGPHTARVKLGSEDGNVTVTSSLSYSTIYTTFTSYLGGPTYPIDNDPEIFFESTNPDTNCFRIASDTVTTVVHSFGQIYGFPWTLNNAEYIARLLYEDITTLAVGTPKTGTFNSTDNVDAYSIFMAAATTYEFELTRTSGSGDFDARLCVWDGLTNSYVRITSGTTFPKTFSYTPAGDTTMLCLVDSDSFSDTGNYRINVTITAWPPVNHAPNVPVVNGPANNSVLYVNHALLNVSVRDPDYDMLDVYFQEEDGTPSGLSYQPNVPGISTRTYNWTGLTPGWHYWQVFVNDEEPLETASGQYRFRYLTAGTNTAPSVYVPGPTNASMIWGPNVNISVAIYDSDGEPLTIEFYNASDNSLIGTTTHPDGSGRVGVFWNGLAPGATFSWYAIVRDHFTSTTSDTWRFTTKSAGDNSAPFSPTLNAPSSGSSVPGPNVVLNVSVFDLDGQTLTVAFYNATDNSLIGSTTIPAWYGSVNMTWSGLAPSQTFSWYVNVSDSFATVRSSTWTFNTQSPNAAPSAPILYSPSNGSTTWSRKVVLEVYVYDADGDSLTIEFYNAANDNLIGNTTDPDGSGSVNVTWPGLTFSQTYSWYVIVRDPLTSTTSTTWTFITPSTASNNAPYAPLLNGPSYADWVTGTTVVLNVSVDDYDGDALTIEFYDASGDILIDNTTDPDGEGNVSVTWSGLVAGQTYSWYVIVSDGINSTRSDTWSFTVQVGFNGGDLIIYIIIGAIAAGIAIPAIVVAKKKKATPAGGTKARTPKLKSSVVQTQEAPSYQEPTWSSAVPSPPVHAAVPTRIMSAVPRPAVPVLAAMICPTCGKRTSLPVPVDDASAFCDACNGSLARIIPCPNCHSELYINKDFYNQYKGRQIACSKCKMQFLLKFD
nr:hypothetical protein [Candidatus Sigynarchaeota archaeon]